MKDMFKEVKILQWLNSYAVLARHFIKATQLPRPLIFSFPTFYELHGGMFLCLHLKPFLSLTHSVFLCPILSTYRYDD
jgi:hypothetical protein